MSRLLISQITGENQKDLHLKKLRAEEKSPNVATEPAKVKQPNESPTIEFFRKKIQIHKN